MNHPVSGRLRRLLNVRYPLFFRTGNELHRWLIDAEGFSLVAEAARDDDQHVECYKDTKYLKVARSIFDEEGRLKPMDQSEWEDEWVQYLPFSRTSTSDSFDWEPYEPSREDFGEPEPSPDEFEPPDPSPEDFEEPQPSLDEFEPPQPSPDYFDEPEPSPDDREPPEL